mgnify:CR=1 FL=1
MLRKLAAGNWKMNGTRAAMDEVSALIAAHPTTGVDILICPPATLISQLAGHVATHPLMIGGQDTHYNTSGAHTGEISSEMLADAGATHVIVGHSERRTDQLEDDALIRAKAAAAHAAGLIAIICVGESLAQREAGETLSVITEQLRQSIPDGATAENTVIAYEPIWAIGTGKTPTLDEIAAVHAHIRASHADLRILYGGSVKGSNADDIFAIANVDGALVGGASLKAKDFSAIISALEAA